MSVKKGWFAKYWVLAIIIFLLVTIPLTVWICSKAFGEKEEMVPIYITVEGLGEGKDMQKREFMVVNYDTLDNVFSMKYEEIYNEFQYPLVANNTFQSLLEVSPSGNQRFYVTINGTEENNLTQAYVGRGAEVVIKYH